MLSTFTNIPVNLWIIMILSQFIHILMKVELDAKTNKEAWREYLTSPSKYISVILSLLQSVTLLIIGYYGYEKYEVKHPELDMSFYLVVGAALVGFSSSSLWSNVMALASKVFGNKTGDQS